MPALPLVVRELQAEARRSSNHWLRMVSAGAVVAAFAFASLNLQVPPAQVGLYLFYTLNAALTLAIWVLVPVLTADCLSSEKREGTIGLLFLTPLTALDIVSGKALIHGLRAATIVLSALPLLTLPFVLGGIPWQAAVYYTFGHLGSLVLALTAGLIASLHNTEWIRSLIMAEALSGLFALVFNGLNYVLAPWLGVRTLINILLIVGLVQFLGSKDGSAERANLFESIGKLVGEPDSQHNRIPGIKRLLPWLLLLGLLVIGVFAWNLFGLGRLLISFVIFLGAIRFAAGHLKANWQKELTSPPQPNWVKIFSDSDFWQRVFDWNKSRTLDRNPIAWLQEYSWTARLTKWGWCVLILAGQIVALLADHRFAAFQSRLSLALMFGIAFSASGSFRRERQTGALELLLVTPLQAWQLIGGRLWGILGHFLPAMAILFSCWLMAPFNWSGDRWLWVCLGLSSYFLLPLIGLYVSMLPMNFLAAWMVTCLLGLIVPFSVMLLIQQSLLRFDPGWTTSVFAWCGSQLLMAALTLHRLKWNLERRHFIFGLA